MRIVHYALGFPPYRSGGLTQYAYDLSRTQAEMGHEVTMLWPGEIGGQRHGIVRLRLKTTKCGVQSAELVNPMPVPLTEGVLEPFYFMRPRSRASVSEVLDILKPDVLHIHTLMGLPRELVFEASARNIPMIFTTHDYYPFCAHVNLFCNGRICETSSNEACTLCCRNALSMQKIILLQTPLYRTLKDSTLVKKLRASYKSDKAEPVYEDENRILRPTEDYEALREYYMSMLERMRVHANSSLALSVYRKYLPLPSAFVLPITHAGITDRRVKKTVNGTLHVAYLAACESYKGFDMLLEAVDMLHRCKNADIVLHVYKPTKEERPYLVKHESFQNDSLASVLSDIHVVVVPSKWDETFGFVVPEALSLGIVPIVTDTVGARDLITDGRTGYIVRQNMNELADALSMLETYPEFYEEVNRNICEMELNFSMREHAKELERYYL